MMHFAFRISIEILDFVEGNVCRIDSVCMKRFADCFSYPLVLVLPKDILDESLKKVARCHKLQR